jgi:hypothetical protein
MFYLLHVTQPLFYEKYQDEKLHSMGVELELKATNRISEIKDNVSTSLSGFKTDMLKWMIGTVIFIILGLAVFHFTSLSLISAGIDQKIEDKIAPIKKILKIH